MSGNAFQIMRFFMTYLAGFIVLVFSFHILGYTYTKSLDQSFYTSNSILSDSEIINLSLGIVGGLKLQEMKFNAANTGHAVDIKIGPAVTDAIKKEFSAIFRSAELIETPTTNSKFDLLAFVETDWRVIRKDFSSGKMDFDVSLKVTFKDKSLKRRIAIYEFQDKAYYSPPSDVYGLAIIEGLSLFLLSPFTIPMKTQAIGKEAERLIKVLVQW